MSVINIIRQTNAIHVVADGLATGPDGRRFIVDKAVPLPSLNAVVAVRGSNVNVCFLAACIARCRSRFDIENKSVGFVREFVQAMPSPTSFELYIAGWDERGKFNCGISSTDGIILNGPAWTVIDLPADNSITPAPFQEEWVPDFWKAVPKISTDKMNIGSVAIELVKLQRRKLAGGSESVGGLVSKITITKRGIDAQVIKQWPHHLNPGVISHES